MQQLVAEQEEISADTFLLILWLHIYIFCMAVTYLSTHKRDRTIHKQESESALHVTQGLLGFMWQRIDQESVLCTV